MAKYKFAEVIFELNCIYSFTYSLCRGYEYLGEENAECVVNITDKDIAREQVLSEPRPKEYLECIAVYRKICDYIFKYKNGMLLHCSAVAYKDKAYLFCAPSGTGKSTHVAIWSKLLGERAQVINDDKPIIREENGKFYVYGTPWSGKHKKDVNRRVEIGALCFISQAKENSISKAKGFACLPLILNQTVRFESEMESDKLLNLISKLINSVELYNLKCNMHLSAGILAFETMVGEKYGK